MKTVLGYHDKTKNSFHLIKDRLPVFVDERYEVFLMTTKQFFIGTTAEIYLETRKFPIQQYFAKIKKYLSTALIIPGTISAALYLLNFLTALAGTTEFPLVLPAWLTNLTFWLAVTGVMMLWHETYRLYKIKERIQPSDSFSEHDLKNFDLGDLGISKRIQTSPVDILTPDAREFLLGSATTQEFDTYKLFSNLLKDEHCQLILKKLDFEDFAKKLEENNISAETLPKYNITVLRSILIYSAEEAVLTGSNDINPEHLFLTIFKLFPVLKQFLKNNKQNISLMRQVVKWLEIRSEASASTRTLDPNIPYYHTGGIAKRWIYGYTYILSHYSKDLTAEIARKGGHYGIGHDKELQELMSTVGKVTKNNALLIGESGTGKTSLAKGLAERINTGRVPQALKNMRVIQLDINGLIASASKHGNLETLIEKTMSELQRAGNTVLFIDEIQEIVPAKGKQSDHSLAGILLPYILESKFPIVGTITYADYKKFFYSRESLRQSFEAIEVSEVTPEAAFEILLTRLEDLEVQNGIDITFPALMSAIELAQRYVTDRKLPDSAVNVIEAACAAVAQEDGDKLTSADVARVVSTQTEIPVEEVTVEEASQLLDLEAKIREKVIGQDEAVHQIVEALKRSRTGIRDEKKPIGSFLFLGPTGVGKTHLAKTISDEYFGRGHELIRLDMSEYKELDSMERLLGKTQVDEDTQTSTSFLDKVKNDPYCVVLLDEIEKAHPQILDVFLQVLDEGHLTNANGETIHFKNAIIIATSNIGSKTLLDALEKDQAMFEEAKQRVLLELRQKVRVEFLNRFDKIIVFSPHDQENLAKISELLLKELKTRLLEKEITLEWEENLPRVIAQKAHQPGLGARPLRRFIQDRIEGVIATKILEGEIKTGGTFKVETQMVSET